MPTQATLEERCLLYLLDRVSVKEEGPMSGELVQSTIAKALGARQSHVARAMNSLSTKGFVRITKIHVRGEGRRKLGYFLTEKGVARAKGLHQGFEELSVTVVDLDGTEKKCRLREIPVLTPRRMRFSDLVANVRRGRLDLRNLVLWRGRLIGGKVYDVRDAIAVAHFSGRSETLSRLNSFLEDSRSRGFLLIGLPGIGKTAVASIWVSALGGQCHVFWRRIRPEMGVRDLLQDFGDMLYSIGRPALSEYLHRPSEETRDLSRSILKRDLSDIRTLIVFDNAHLASDDVAGLITELVGTESSTSGPKIFLLSRERISFWGAEYAALGKVIEEELTDLHPDEAFGLLTALDVDAYRRDVILARCGGHPLSLELAATKAMPLQAIRRTSVDRIVEDVLSRLSGPVRETLALAAMFEGAVPPEVLGGHAPELLRLCLLREDDVGKVSVHDLVREASIQGMNPKQIAAMHLLAGDVMAQSGNPSDSLEAIRHMTAGGEMRSAAELAVSRGQDLIDSGMAEGLVNILPRLTWTPKEDELRIRTVLLQGNALFALGRWIESIREYEKCSSASEPHAASEALLGQGKAEVQRNSPLALQHLEAAQERFEQLGALRQLAETQYWIGGFHEDSGHPDQARDAFEKGRIIAFSIGDRRWEGLCRYGVGRIRSSLEGLEAEVEEEREALRLLEIEGSRLDIAKVCSALGGALAELHKEGEAETYITRAASEARRTGAMGVLASSLYNLASLKFVAGKAKEAFPLLQEALELHEQLEKYDEAAWCAAWIASEEWLEGHGQAGDSYAARADRLLSRTSEPALRVQAIRNIARASLRAGRNEEAGQHLGRAISEAEAAGLDKWAADLKSELEGIH